MTLDCPKCGGGAIHRSRRNAWDRLLRRSVVYRCEACAWRFAPRKEKHAVKYCLCGADLDRRNAKTAWDRFICMFGLRVYSCRRCATKRYRF